MTWILLLMLVTPDGHGVAIESVPGFATWEACNSAGSDARGLPVLTSPGGTGRVDWVCVSTGTAPATGEARDRALEKLRAELREIVRRTRTAKEGT